MYLHAAYDIGVNSRCKGIWHVYAADNRWTGDPHLMLEWRHCVMVSRAQCMTIHLCIAREMVICHNPHSLLDWDYRITTQLDYKPTFCQNCVHKKVACL